MRPSYHLADHIHFCEIDSSAVFLDLRKGDYFAIGPRELDELKNTVGPWKTGSSGTDTGPQLSSGNQSTIIEMLLGKGVLSTTPRSFFLDNKDLPIERNYYSSHNERQLAKVTLLQIFAFLACYLYVCLNLKRNQLERVIKKLRKPRRSQHDSITSDSTVHRFVALFDRLRPWAYTAHQQCLKDSLTLAHFLRWNGIPATLVLGVRTKPFAAHAWVQVANCLVNDETERVQLYTPILIARTAQ